MKAPYDQVVRPTAVTGIEGGASGVLVIANNQIAQPEGSASVVGCPEPLTM